MADGKLNLPEDLGPLTNPPAAAADSWTNAKEYGGGGIAEEKALMGFLDVSKDHSALENSSIPLSPQWLYAKPGDGKIGLSAALGDTRSPNLLPRGALADFIHKDTWRLEGSQEKKDRRRNLPEVESSRRWREEERETGLLGRRERRKEGDRDNEYRKNDRRSDNIPKEAADPRTPPSSDRWHEVASRTSGHESRRDSKWSSRWGPDDKEKDSRMDKKTDGDKEDPPVEKQSVIGGSRQLSESDSRDKWWPRHRREIHSVGSAVYRAAPGFGAERGRVEGQNIGFAPGRGRSNFVAGLSFSRPSSSGPIGAAPPVKSESLHGKSSLSADTFCYPRGKLLDIYRKNRMLSIFDSTPEGFEEVPQITQSSSMVPLAFIKPDLEEVAVLEDVRKGKVMSSEVCDSIGQRMGQVSECVIDSVVGVNYTKTGPLSNEKDPSGMTSASLKDDSCYNVPDSLSHSEKKDTQANMENNDGHVGLPDSLSDEKFGDSTSLDNCTKLPDDPSTLFNASSIHTAPSSDNQHLDNNVETELIGQGISIELTLFYLDPQKEIQGPFLAEDIISWYNEGFFGMDLPVVLSNAPEGTHFRPLGEVIQELSMGTQSSHLTNPGEQPDPSDTIRGNLDTVVPASDVSRSFASNGQQQISLGDQDPFSHQVQPRISEPEASIASQYVTSPISNAESYGGNPGAERQSLNHISWQDSEEVLYMGRSVNSIHNPLGNLANEIHGMSQPLSGHQFLPSEIGQAISTNHRVPTDNDVNPLGLSWSELEGAHHKGPLSTNIAGVGDRGHIINPLVGDDASLFRHKQEQYSVKGNSVGHESWSSDYRRNTSSDVLQDVLDASQLTRLVPESNRFNLEEHLLSQQLQKQELQQQELQQQHLISHQNMHLSGSYMEQLQGPSHHQRSMNQSVDMERLLKLQFQQQRHLQQLEQQHQLHHHQQQQIHHRMQLLQQQHQQQQHQLLLDQLLHQQLHDPNFGVPHVDPLRGENTFDQVLYRQRLLHELQQQTHHLSLDHEPSLDQLIQAKYGHNLRHEHHNELLDALNHPSQRHMLPLEQQFLVGLQQEQLQSRQIPTASRQQPGMDEDRHVGGAWSFDEPGQFMRAGSSHHQTHSSRLGRLDLVQPLERLSSIEQQHYLERNFHLHDRMQLGNYGLNSHPIERSAGTSRTNMDLISNMGHLQGMDMLENHGQMNPSVQMGPFPSGSRSQQNWMPNQFANTHVDAMERNWSEPNAQLNSLIKSQFTQLHHQPEKQMRDMQADRSIEDLYAWSSHTGNDEISNHGLTDLLHEKSIFQSSQPLGMVDGAPASSYSNREHTWHSSFPATDHSFNLAVDKMGLGDSFAEGSHFTKLGHTPKERSMNLNLEGPVNTFESSKLFRSNSGVLADQKQFLSGFGEIDKEQNVLKDRVGAEFSDLNGVRVNHRGSKSISTDRSVLEMLEGAVDQSGTSVIDHGALKSKGLMKHASFWGTGGVASLYNYNTGTDNAYVDESVNDRMSDIFSRGPDSSLHTRDPHISTSQGPLSEPVPVPPMKGKSSTTTGYSNDVRRDPGGNPSDPASDTSCSRKDTRFHRVSSYGDADAPETSFIDMLKGTRKNMPETDASPGAAESADAGPGGRSSSKKKGKKGRQIDPSLLGFKVHSNRILMGEIQRPDD